MGALPRPGDVTVLVAVDRDAEAALSLVLGGREYRVALARRGGEPRLVIYLDGKIIAHAALTDEEADQVEEWLAAAQTPYAAEVVILDLLDLARRAYEEGREGSYISDEGLRILAEWSWSLPEAGK